MTDKAGYYVSTDNSIASADGKLLFCSAERFKPLFVDGDVCFICGRDRSDVQFNDEHVIPRWLLQELSLFNETITIPGGSRSQYGQWTSACCTECNSLLGKTIEKPVSAILKGAFSNVSKYVKDKGCWLLFEWMNLIFLKMYLRSMPMRVNPDNREPKVLIGDLVDWDTMHHIHCVARARYTDADVDPRIAGSMLVVPAKSSSDGEQFADFDYADYLEAKAVMVRFRNVGIVCILDDAGGTLSTMPSEIISKIGGPLSPLQLRELTARIAYASSLIREKPVFCTTMKAGALRLTLQAYDKIETEEGNQHEFGRIMHHFCAQMMKDLPSANPDFSMDALREGKWTFLWDAEGNFDHNSMQIVPREDDTASGAIDEQS